MIQLNRVSFLLRNGPYLTSPLRGLITCIRIQRSTKNNIPHIGRKIAELQKSPRYLLSNGATANINTTFEMKISTKPSSNVSLKIFRSACLRDNFYLTCHAPELSKSHLSKKYFVFQSSFLHFSNKGFICQAFRIIRGLLNPPILRCSLPCLRNKGTQENY